jgi:hypothetical protein
LILSSITHFGQSFNLSSRRHGFLFVLKQYFMSKAKSCTIPKAEYDAYEPARLSEGDFAIGGLYEVFFALAANQAGHEAASYPAEIIDYAHMTCGYYEVNFVIGNLGHAPDLRTAATFYDGHWFAPLSDGIDVNAEDQKIPVINGFLRAREDTAHAQKRIIVIEAEVSREVSIPVGRSTA